MVAQVALAGVVGWPLFNHLRTTASEARIDQLRGPIDAALSGEFGPLLTNVVTSLRIFTIEGDNGTIIWRYNIPGRPILTPIVGILFYIGLVLAITYIFRKKWQLGSLLAIVWLVAGFSPALVTGPEASTTRAIAMQPALFIFPALAVDWLWGIGIQYSVFSRQSANRKPNTAYRLPVLLTVALIAFVALNSANAYFNVWANHPDVRLQYEVTLVKMMAYLDEQNPPAAAVSVDEPNQFHDPSTAFLTRQNHDTPIRWFDGRWGLSWPNSAETHYLSSTTAPLHPTLQSYLTVIDTKTRPLRPNDLDTPITIQQTTQPTPEHLTLETFVPVAPTTLGTHATLLGYDLLTQAPAPGETIQLATLWQINQSISGLTLFTHVQTDPSQPPIAQRDLLSVPSHYWQPGDYFIQLHETNPLPADLISGRYQLNIGGYIRPNPNTFQRLPISQNGEIVGDSLQLITVEINK